MKVAVTNLSANITGLQGPSPLHAPDHPPNTDIAFGVYSSSTVELYGYGAVPVHDEFVHEIPKGSLVTVPLPFPERFTVMLCEGGSKLADIFVRLRMVVVQVPAPEHPPPDQPVKVWPVLVDAP